MLYESGENYLETILLLYKKNGQVRSVDIATELNFSKPSVSRAVGILKKAKLITVDASGLITLTQSGLEQAMQINERHNTLTRYLVAVLGVSEETASADACRIEHVISAETFTRIKEALL